jgi:hypothetical protein
MKTRRLALATVVILISSFVFTSSLVRADDWYQGRQGRWVQEQNAWRFRDSRGNEYRQYGNSWRWGPPPMVRADADDYWYQGRRGRWVQAQNGWRFRDVDGNVYRQHGNGWQWYNGRAHGAEGSEYHNRAPGDNRTYQEFQQQERH